MARQRTPDDLDQLVEQIRQSKKYRTRDICEETIRDVLTRELARLPRKKAIRTARERLHHIVATYLGEPDHAAALAELRLAFSSEDEHEIKLVCARIMSAHVSTKERLPLLDQFYARIFQITGKPNIILDLACGLNPLSFPWSGLPLSTRYFAYDLNQQRIEFLSAYFELQGLMGVAKVQDVLVKKPEEKGDVALILKEAHRFERRQRGSTISLCDALDAHHLVLSFPRRSLSGRRGLDDIYRRFLHNLIAERPWRVKELEFENELVFCLERFPSRDS